MSPEPKERMTNMRSEAFFIYSRGAYTIFLPGEAEHATFAMVVGSKSGTFVPLGKTNIYALCIYLNLNKK